MEINNTSGSNLRSRTKKELLLEEVWPESDSDGYPTEKTLKYIREWPIPTKTGGKELLEFCMEAWKYEEYAFEEKGEYIFQTGGWSGNEDIISAMRDNHMFWMFCWYSSTRGGCHKFDIVSIVNRNEYKK